MFHLGIKKKKKKKKEPPFSLKKKIKITIEPPFFFPYRNALCIFPHCLLQEGSPGPFPSTLAAPQLLSELPTDSPDVPKQRLGRGHATVLLLGTNVNLNKKKCFNNNSAIIWQL